MRSGKLQKIDVLSSAKVVGIMMTIVGLVAGILYSFGGAIIDALVSIGWVSTTETPGLSYGTVLAFGALIGMPMILAVPGFVVGAVLAVLYNLVAARFGGIEMDFGQ